MRCDRLARMIRRFPGFDLTHQQTILRLLVDIHPTLSGHWGGKWTYRRVRKLDPGYVPKHTDEVIWRKGVPAPLMRANPPGFSLLYLGDRMETAFREARVENDPVALTTFQILHGQTARVATVGEHLWLNRQGRGYLLCQEPPLAEHFIEMQNACDPEEARSLLMTDSFLLECLTNREGNYEISSAVAKAMFDKIPEISAIAFPSVRQAGAVNFAVRVENFFDHWGIHAVRLGRAVHLAQGFYRFTDDQHVRHICKDGKLTWHDSASGACHFFEPWVPGRECSTEIPSSNR